MPATTRRRVSYVIPPPNEPVQRLQLPPFAVPRNGATGPHLIPSPNSLPYEVPKSRHPRHRLGVVSLALDTSTHLAGRSAPEGILYSGARDGLVCSWDLELPMRKREEEQRRFVGRWEGMTGWGDDVIDEEEDSDDKIRSDGDILGEVSSPRRRRADGSIPYEQSWEIDSDAYKPGQVCYHSLESEFLTHSGKANSISAMLANAYRLGQRHAVVQLQPDCRVCLLGRKYQGLEPTLVLLYRTIHHWHTFGLCSMPSIFVRVY